MSKKCPDCGSLNVEEVFDGESYCKDCFLHCATDDLEDASVFDRTTASPDVLAEKLVYKGLKLPNVTRVYYYSTLCGDVAFETKEEAIAATVARLKEMAE